MVAAFGFGFSFWLHQWRIPHRMCRFYLLLAGAVEERQGISIPYPSPTPLLTPWGIRCGGASLLPRVWDNLVSLYPVQIVNPHFDVSFGCCVFGLKSLAFQLGCPAGIVRFSLLDGKKTLLEWLCSFVFWITANREIVPISLDASPFHQCCRVQKCYKTAFVRLKLQENGHPIQDKSSCVK